MAGAAPGRVGTPLRPGDSGERVGAARCGRGGWAHTKEPGAVVVGARTPGRPGQGGSLASQQVLAVVEAHPQRYRAVPLTTTGCGLRQGECFGLAVEAVDFLGRCLHVVQQVKLLAGKPVLAPPKGGKEREVPLPDAVAFALAEHIRRFPPVEVTLPWRTLDGQPRTAALVFTTRERGPLTRRHYNVNVWKPALKKAHVEPTRKNGMHALRHHYASVLLNDGVSIRALADYLGHADPGFTLRVYCHLMPDSEDRARQAVDAALGREPNVSQEVADEAFPQVRPLRDQMS